MEPFLVAFLAAGSATAVALFVIWLAAQEPEKHHGVCVRHYHEGKLGDNPCPDCGALSDP